MSVDLWVEVASPLKHSVKNAFFDFAKKIYEEKKIIFSSYFPSVMGGDMALDKYLFNMNKIDAPQNYLTMGYGECSDIRFHEKYIRSGFYSQSKIVAYFAETMVVDLQRLGKRPIPQSFFDLSSPIYKNEICIIGTKDIPDPMLALNFYYGKGEEEMNAFIENLALLAPPVYAIRHIGKSSNKYGSIFVMPLLFANVCKEIKNAKVIMPKEGFFAEPFILFSKNPDEEKTKLIIDFFNSKEFSKVISEKYFIPESKKSHSLIYKECLKTFFPEVSKIYPLLRKKLSGVPHQNLRS